MLKHWIGKTWLDLFGWRAEGEALHPKFVLIAAPHTSNWDVPFMLSASYALRAPISWLGKHTLFEPAPMGWFMRSLGAIPVDRRSRHNSVEWAIDLFNRSERLVLALSAEGTREHVKHWKSGFYHIAKGAKVPIGLGFLDYKRKIGGIGPFITPTEDVRADMDKIRAFYKGIRGKYSEQESVPRLREEEDLAPTRS
jgi:1-acyl-sn-glycerol-3-phosphate acyltransferase